MNDPDDLTTISFSSPDHAIMKVSTSTIKRDSVYDKLGELSGAIENGIRSFSLDPRSILAPFILITYLTYLQMHVIEQPWNRIL